MKFEINIEKKHFWVIIAVIVLLFGVVIVIATTTWTTDQPFHEPLYTDTIAGKSGGGVTVDDELEVTGKVTVDDDLYVGGVINVDVTWDPNDCQSLIWAHEHGNMWGYGCPSGMVSVQIMTSSNEGNPDYWGIKCCKLILRYDYT